MKFLKRWIPPVVADMANNICRSSYGWSGDYTSWSEARNECAGYEAENILEKCRTALLKVKNGKAVYERDSVLFDTVEYSWPVLSGLLRCAVDHDCRLHVLDFGGSLGSSYYQNRRLLSGLKEFTWRIVEQKHFVACGKESFEDGVLRFCETFEEALREKRPNVLLLSSVLQYLEKPYESLERFLAPGIDCVILDRLALSGGERDRLTVQRVPPEIYEAAYPTWFLSEQSIRARMSVSYDLWLETAGFERSNLKGMYFKNFVFRRKGGG